LQEDSEQGKLTDIPRIKKRKERGDGENVIELRQRRHLEELCLIKDHRGLAGMAEC
jgi:hypothetical protein